jgi:DNA helicase II / ATP-dependent DNA helicase PcrA
MTDPRLVTLNPEQRRAVEHGAEPLLIIAGAGTGKTNTLPHRVAHLIVGGGDSRRIMLLTFSRRAAEEISRRVQRIASHVLPKQARLIVGALTWSGALKLDTWTAINEQSEDHR